MHKVLTFKTIVYSYSIPEKQTSDRLGKPLKSIARTDAHKDPRDF